LQAAQLTPLTFLIMLMMVGSAKVPSLLLDTGCTPNTSKLPTLHTYTPAKQQQQQQQRSTWRVKA
jgi:hypothetical protein